MAHRFQLRVALGLCASLVASAGANNVASPFHFQTRLREFRVTEADIETALETLRRAATEVDPQLADLNVVVDGDAASVPHITLHLRRVSLYDALRYIAELAGLHLRIEENVVVLSRDPGPPARRLVTRIYPVQPSILDAARRSGGRETEPRGFFPR